MLKAVTRERDQALQALRTRGLLPEEEAQVRGRPPPESSLQLFLPGPLEISVPPARGKTRQIESALEVDFFSHVSFKMTVHTR